MRVIYSLNLKFTLLQTLMFVLLFVVIMKFASTILIEDKNAYIYESLMVNVKNSATVIKLFYDKEQSTVRDIGTKLEGVKYYRDVLNSSLFKSYENLIDITIYDSLNKDMVYYKHNESFFSKYRVSEVEYFASFPEHVLNNNKLITVDMLGDKKILTYVRFVYNDSLNSKLYVFRVSIVKALEDVYKASVFKSIIISASGSIIAHSAPEMISDDFRGFYQEFVARDVGDTENPIVKEYYMGPITQSKIDNIISSVIGFLIVEDFSKKIVASSRVVGVGAIVISEINKADAFLSVIFLFVRTIFFSMCTISLMALVTFFVSKRITSRIKSLTEVTKFIASGHYDKLCPVSGSDETTVLAKSFNLMVKEIQRNIMSLEEKQRMKHELDVAKQVQQAFFADVDSKNDHSFDVKGHYLPLCECGGDWYTFIKTKRKGLIFIGDATGHGVPAALVTASVNACANMIKLMLLNGDSNYGGVDAILMMLNKVICSMNGNINMTFFAGAVDLKTGEFEYASASHNPPMLYISNKQEVVWLQEARGNILGQDFDSKYSIARGVLERGDCLLCYTDGVIDAVNGSGRSFGDKKLMKIFLQRVKVNSSCDKIVSGIVGDIMSHCDGTVMSDDLSLLAFKMSEHD